MFKPVLWMCAVGLALSTPAIAGPAVATSVEIQDTRFKVTLVDGRTLMSKDLIGAVLTVGVEGRLLRARLDAVEADPDSPAGDVWLHSLSAPDADGSWQPICQPGPDGRRSAFPVAGRLQADGRLVPAEPGVFHLVCTGGALGKCVRFGYRPWADGPDGRNLLAAYNACVRMVRADYGGAGDGTTRTGMRIDYYDSLGLNRHEGDPIDSFEAGWGPDGAVCVHHVRVRENTSLAALEDKYPQLRGRTGAVCTEAFARARGAVVFNRSPQ